MDSLQTATLRSLLDADQVTVSQAVSTFLRAGMVGKSPATRAWYERRLSNLLAYLGAETPVGSVMLADLVDWYAELESRESRWGGNSSHPEEEGGLSAYYLHSLVRSARFFFKWLYQQKVIPANPAENLELPGLPKTGRRGIADKDAEKILHLARRGISEGAQERDYALLKFMESTGARLSGIAGLTLDRIQVFEPEPLCRRATVIEKGEKERAVFMTPKAVEAMRVWLTIRQDSDYERVFLGRTNGLEWSEMSPGGIYQVVERYARAAGVKVNWSPHQWRHRLGRKLAEQGVSLGVISQILGHESVEITVSFYGKFAVSEQQKIYDAAMPDL